MKRTMRVMVVLGLLGAALAARMARAEEPEPMDEPGLVAELEAGDDMADAGPAMHGGPGFGSGHGMRGGMRMRRGMRLDRMIGQLDLTAAQREKLKLVREREARKAIQTRADIQLARLDLRQLMEADKPDQRSIEAQIDKIAALRTGLEKSRVATMLEIRASLTAEQQKKLKELREQGPQMRNRQMAPRRGGGISGSGGHRGERGASSTRPSPLRPNRLARLRARR